MPSSSSIQSRIDRALDLIATSVRLFYHIALVLILLLATLLSVLFFPLSPLTLPIILTLALAAILYLKSKKDAISDLIEDADDRTSVPPRNPARAFPKRIVLRVLDHVLGTAADSAMLVPLAFVAVAAVAFVFGYNHLGFGAAGVAAFCLALVLGLCHIAKLVAYAWVDRLFGDVPEEPLHKGEKTPLLPPRKV